MLRKCILGCAAVLLVAGTASAQLYSEDYTKQELICMRKADKADAKAFVTVQKCFRKCIERARKGDNPFAECAFPFGGKTSECLFDAPKGAQPKMIQQVEKGCEKDVAECYVPGVAATITQWATDQYLFSQAATEFSAPTVYCADLQGVATKKEIECAKAVSTNLSRLWVNYRSILGRCKLAEARGKTPLGSCDPPATREQTAKAIDKLLAKVTKGIEKKCKPGDGLPQCHIDGGFGTPQSWIDLTLSALDPIVYPFIYCGS